MTAEATRDAPTATSDDALRVGLALGTGLSALAVVPAALRVSGAGAGFAVALLGLWGAATLMVAPVAAGLRLSRPWGAGIRALCGGVLLAAAPLMIFGRVLTVATHHRPLGAVTFTLVGLVLLFACVIVAGRLRTWATTRARRLVQLGLYALAGVTALRFAAPLLAKDAGFGASVLDAALLALVAGVAALAPAPTFARRPWVGPLLAVAVVVVGAVVGAGPAFSSAPVPRAAFSALGR